MLGVVQKLLSFTTHPSPSPCPASAQLQRALKILGVAMSRPEVELLIKEIDSNGDGEVSCDELLQYVLSFDGGDDERGH